MKNPFPYSFDNKRYHTLSYHFKSQGVKVQKAIIDIAATCPNQDGTKAFGGCIYCNGNASYFSRGNHISVTKQLELESERIYKKWGRIPILAYFQGGTNTYLPTKKLSLYIDEVLKFPNIFGISIATRPDCIEEDMLEFLAQLAFKTNLTIELGLQTVHDSTAKIINRAYEFNVFEKTFKKLKEKNIRVCVHIIDGLPNENNEMMLETAKILGKMKPDAVKIHLLHVIKNTKLAEDYHNGLYQAMSFDNYVNVVVEQLEYFPCETVIERITGDAQKDELLSPMWSKDKIKVLGSIDVAMKNQNTYQGLKYLAE